MCPLFEHIGYFDNFTSLWGLIQPCMSLFIDWRSSSRSRRKLYRNYIQNYYHTYGNSAWLVNREQENDTHTLCRCHSTTSSVRVNLFLKSTKLNFTCMAPLSSVFFLFQLPHSVLELHESGYLSKTHQLYTNTKRLLKKICSEKQIKYFSVVMCCFDV